MEGPVVVDTSALIDAADANRPAWGETVTRLMGERGAIAPELVAYEAGNVVHGKHPEAFGETPQERAVILELLLEGVERIPSTEDVRTRCARLVDETDLTFYDAAFLDLAESTEGSLLLTQDETLASVGKVQLGPDRCLRLDEAVENHGGGTSPAPG